MSYMDPDIQEAPVYPVLFTIEQNGNSVLTINPNEEFIVHCAVYIPAQLRQQIKQQDHFIYATIIDSGSPIIQKIGSITPPVYSNNNEIMQFIIAFELGNRTDANQINLQIAITAKHKGEMGIGESLRVGRFINTYLPLEKEHE